MDSLMFHNNFNGVQHTFISISDNAYFHFGIQAKLSLIEKQCAPIMTSDVPYYLFDLSSYFFRYLSDNKWMSFFPPGSHLILFPDIKMLPLANYWFFHATQNVNICAVIQDHHDLEFNIKHIVSGKKRYPSQRAVLLTENEYLILEKMVCGFCCVQKIAKLTKKSSKTIYAQKTSLERKLKSKIKGLLSLSLSSQF